MKEKESMDYKDIKISRPTVYVVQEIAGTREGRPKFNIMGAAEYGKLKFLLDERSQMIFSPGPLIFKLKNLIERFQTNRSLVINRRSCYNRCCLQFGIRCNKWQIQSLKVG
jgi:hypothetical protein